MLVTSIWSSQLQDKKWSLHVFYPPCLSTGYLEVFCILVGLAGGMAGLWAGCSRDKLAAKLFFLSWPTSLVLSIVSWILRGVTEQLDNKDVSGSHLVPSTFTFVIYSIWIFFSIYFMKVFSMKNIFVRMGRVRG